MVWWFVVICVFVIINVIGIILQNCSFFLLVFILVMVLWKIRLCGLVVVISGLCCVIVFFILVLVQFKILFRIFCFIWVDGFGIG